MLHRTAAGLLARPGRLIAPLYAVDRPAWGTGLSAWRAGRSRRPGAALARIPDALARARAGLCMLGGATDGWFKLL
jgi:hypothetical protein